MIYLPELAWPVVLKHGLSVSSKPLQVLDHAVVYHRKISPVFFSFVRPAPDLEFAARGAHQSRQPPPTPNMMMAFDSGRIRTSRYSLVPSAQEQKSEMPKS